MIPYDFEEALKALPKPCNYFLIGHFTGLNCKQFVCTAYTKLILPTVDIFHFRRACLVSTNASLNNINTLKHASAFGAMFE